MDASCYLFFLQLIRKGINTAFVIEISFYMVVYFLYFIFFFCIRLLQTSLRTETTRHSTASIGGWFWGFRLKWSKTLQSLFPVLSTCFLSVEKLQPKNKFNQRSEKMQKQRKIVKEDQTTKKFSHSAKSSISSSFSRARDNSLSHIL